MTSNQRAVLAVMDPDRPMAYWEIGDAADISANAAKQRLFLLEDHGMVERTSTGRWLPTPKAEPIRQRAIYRARKKSAPPKRTLKAKPFKAAVGQKRYGQLFMIVRVMRCWLDEAGYDGPGHDGCGMGAQGGATAHHLHPDDADGLVPVCGRAHDLLAGRGSRTTQRAFGRWVREHRHDIEEIGQIFVRRAEAVIEKGSYDGVDLNW